MRKKFRFLTVLAVCVMVLSCFSVTAFAYADDTEQNLPVTEATQPEQQPAVTPAPEKPKGEPIDDEGNACTRDLLYDKATNKQFITVQTKNGNTFFIVIDYHRPGAAAGRGCAVLSDPPIVQTRGDYAGGGEPHRL